MKTLGWGLGVSSPTSPPTCLCWYQPLQGIPSPTTCLPIFKSNLYAPAQMVPRATKLIPAPGSNVSLPLTSWWHLICTLPTATSPLQLALEFLTHMPSLLTHELEVRVCVGGRHLHTPHGAHSVPGALGVASQPLAGA